MKTETWMDFANCKGMNTNDFYPEFGVKGAAEQVRKMKTYCRNCAVSFQCLQFAMDNNEYFGIWGGLTPKERENLRRQRRRNTIDTVVKVVKKNDSNKI